MATMKIQNMLQYMDVDEVLLEDDPSAYNSYTIPTDTVITIDTDSNDDWYTVTYAQVIKENGIYSIVVQLEGLPFDPVTCTFNTNIDVRIYKQII